MSRKSDDLPPEASQTQLQAIRRKQDGTFEKGVSGNPLGRPLDALGPTIRKKLSGKKLESHIDNVIAAAEAGDMRAVEILWNRGWGKPAMAQEDREAMAAQQGGGLEALLGIYGLVRKVAPALPPKDEDE